ncbi:hypothetical protein DBV15_12061, partial [Temnothorax longispinosus]
MCRPDVKSDEWIICASKYRGTIYLCEFRPDERERGQDNATVSDKQISTGTNKFQQYIVADHPLHEPDSSSVPVNECGEFHCMFKANFSNVSLLYGAKIDAISSRQPITDTLIGKPFESIGLKTLLMPKKHSGCTRSTVIKCWSTNFLANTNRIVVGFRDATNTVKEIKEYSMADLLRLSKPPCEVELCKAYLTAVLKSIKNYITEDYNKCIYKWRQSPKGKLKFTKEAPNNEIGNNTRSIVTVKIEYSALIDSKTRFCAIAEIIKGAMRKTIIVIDPRAGSVHVTTELIGHFSIDSGFGIIFIELRGHYQNKNRMKNVDARERGQDNAVVENQISSKINKFQQYIVADHPLHEPDSSVPLNESEEFHCMFKANFAGISLLYDAKIDAISSQQLITDTLIGKPFESIGLKMFQMRIRHMRSTPGIISKCWSTNFLANANRIVVGFRDATNTVKVIKEYSMADLLRLSKFKEYARSINAKLLQPYCDVELCKTYLTVVLKTIKQSVTKDYNKCIYKFHRQPVKETNKEVFLLELTEEAPNNEIFSWDTKKNILCSPYGKSDEWIICASINTVVQCEFHSDERDCGQDNATVSDKQISAGTNKFQQYIVADHLSHKPDPSVPLNKCEEFYCMFKANFGNHSLLYDARMNAISSQQTITDTLIGKTFEWIGLKTFRMRSRNMHSTPRIVSKCWSTNYLVDANRIVVGFRDATNIVKVIKEYSMDDLLKLSKYI